MCGFIFSTFKKFWNFDKFYLLSFFDFSSLNDWREIFKVINAEIFFRHNYI